MKSVMQTILAPPNGNCMAACVASILEKSIDEVPNPHGEDWWEQWLDWLQKVDLYLINVEFEKDGWRPPGYWIADVDSPREFTNPDGTPVAHGVVALKNKIVHDPHPFAKNFRSPDINTTGTIVIICKGAA